MARARNLPCDLSVSGQVTLAPKTVLVGDDRDWPSDLRESLGRGGYTVDRVTELSLVPPLLAKGETRALFVVARPLAASDLLLLRRVREMAPRTAIVVVTRTPTHPDLKRAFENGATAFLSWPASTQVLRQAVESGGEALPTAAAPSPRPDAGAVIVSNRLPPRHPRRLDLENAVRGALAGLEGRWDVVLEVPGGSSLVVSVVSPDGSAWSMSCYDPERRDPASIAETVRAACVHRRHLDPPAGRDDDSRTGAERPAAARERS